jgi:PTS system mannose-specific IID component
MQERAQRRSISLAADQRSYPAGGGWVMNRAMLTGIFLRSLTVQASFNFWRMQNLGFAFALIPLIKRYGNDPIKAGEMVAGQMQMFNTHPYMVAPVIGSVVRLGEEGRLQEVAELKKVLMGPYAAIGDSFFWGALRSFTALWAVIAGFAGVLPALAACLLLYLPAQIWVRAMGFWEGYRRGRNGIDFIRRLDLPGLAGKIRHGSLILIGVLAALNVHAAGSAWPEVPAIPAAVGATAILFLFLIALRRGISAVTLLYGTGLLCMVLTI